MPLVKSLMKNNSSPGRCQRAMVIRPSRWLGSVKQGCLGKWLSVRVWLRKLYSDWLTAPADAIVLAGVIPTLERNRSAEAVSSLALLQPVFPV